MAEDLNRSMLVPEQFDFKALVEGNVPLSFLVGAGISMDPPSCLASARQLINAIIAFGAPAEDREGLLAIRQLRYEMLVQLFRDVYDAHMDFARYFDTAVLPNKTHHFLASMARKGHFVVTTNFDSLIENAIGIHDPLLKVIITRADFEEAGDPVRNADAGDVVVYKIHGSPRNIVTGEDTRGSIVSTLDALGKHKGGEVFAIETFKRPFFERVCDGRTLVVMGYSGGDDLDLVPTLLRMKGLSRVVWISHVQDIGATVHTFKVDPSANPPVDSASPASNVVDNRTPENMILFKLACIGHVDVYKVVGHTGSIIESFGTSTGVVHEGDTDQPPPAIEWLRKHYPAPKQSTMHYFAGMLYQAYNRYTAAIENFKKAQVYYDADGDAENANYQLVNAGAMLVQSGNATEARSALHAAFEKARAGGFKHLEAMATMNMGNLLVVTGDPHGGIEHLQRALAINEELGNDQENSSILNNIGVVHMNTGSLDAAIEAFDKAIAIDERFGSLEGLAGSFSNKGAVYQKRGDLDKALAANEQSLAIAQKIGHHEGVALNMGNLGLIKRRLGQVDDAIKLHREACELYRGLGVPQGMAQNLGGLGLALLSVGRNGEARDAFTRALDIETRLGNLHGQAIQLGYLGHLNINIGKLDDAFTCYGQALTIDEKLGYLDRVAGDVAAMAGIRMKLGPVDQALELYGRARSLFEKMGNSRMVALIDQAVQPVKNLLS